MDIELLKNTPGFSAVPDVALRALIKAAGAPRLLQPDEVLYRADQEWDKQVHVLVSGSLSIERRGQPAQLYPPGYLLGLSGYLTGGPYAATARAIQASEVVAIDAVTLAELELTHPSLADTIERLIGASLRNRHVDIPAGIGALTQSVSTAMSTPIQHCDEHATLADAVSTMSRNHQGALLLSGTDDARLVTYASLARRLIEDDVDASQHLAASAAQTVPIVNCDEPVWKAQDLLLRCTAKYLLVIDGGQPVGIISQTDIMRTLVARQTRLAVKVHEAHDFDALRERYETMHNVAAELLHGNRSASTAIRSLSETHLAIQSRCFDLTLEQMQSDNLGPAPVPFALIIMGSGGRREMMLDPDQDNGLIIDNQAANDPRALEWFETLAQRLNVNLDACGYVLCPGQIMARNASYRKTLSQWQEQISTICARPNERAARWSSIMFDFDTQRGDPKLTRSLRSHVNSVLSGDPRLLHFMVGDDAHGRAPLNWFNRLIATGQRDGEDTVDIKRNGLRMIANAARILALEQGISNCTTGERIRALSQAGIISDEFKRTITDAFDELLGILLTHQLRQRRAGQAPDKQVAPKDLSDIERGALRVSMRAVKRFQELVQNRFGGAQP